MSKTVDERVVSMQFDNKKFEKNVQTSIKTLDKLKSKLNLKDAAKGLENVDKATKKLDMTPLTNGIHTVGLKFSALQVAATTALANIANSAVNAGKRLVSAFTVDPIKTGLQEYETQINAVQTILANTQSKGTTLDQVNAALDELNHYADMTIYNFTEMTRNIGTFTAAGVDLDTSVSAIKGIANLAAVSGSTSQQASSAMYQLSQALASGTVKLMDWNSVVNAGMGGQVFQDALKETARVHGIAIDDMIKDEGSFRETLSNGWLTSEILTETLSKFTGDLSEEQLKSMGYTEEQIKEIIKLGKTANDAATKVKTFTQLMSTLKEAAQSGWTQTWEILIGDFEEAKALWTSVSDVFSEIINSSAEARNNMLQAWADAGGRDMVIDSLKNAFKSLLSIIKPIKEAFREIFPATTSNQLLKITENIKKFTEKLILSEKAQEKLKSTFKGLFAVIDIGVTIIKEVVAGIAKLTGKIVGFIAPVIGATGSFGDLLSSIRDSIKESGFFAKVIGTITDGLGFLIGKLETVLGFLSQKILAPGFEGFLSLIKGIWKVISFIGEKIGNVITTITNGLTSAFRNGDMKSALDLVNGGIITAILLTVKKFINGFTSSLDEITSIAGKVTGILDSVKGCFEAYQKDLNAKTLLKIAGAIGILAAAILIIASIDPARLTAALGSITFLFANLIGAMALLNKIGAFQKGLIKASIAMVGVSIAVLVLAGALKIVSSIDTDSMISGLIGVAALSAMVVAMAKALSSNTKTIIKGAGSLILFALAIKVLASACKNLSSLSWGEMIKGLAGVGALMAGVALFLNKAKFNNKAISTAAGILILSVAIRILASACAKFASMNWDEIVRGLTGMAGALLAIIVAIQFMPKNMLSIGAGLLIISTAILILSHALTSLGGMSWEEVSKGLISLGGALLILAIGLNVMSGTLAGSAALLIAAVAIGLLTPALLILGSMSWESIGKGLLTLAGAFVILGVAGYTLRPVVPVILALSVALALAGAGMLAFGVGMVAIGIGLTTLATAFATSGAIIISGITAIITAIIGLIPSIIAAIGQGIILICDTIANSVSSIMRAVKAIITAVMGALEQSIPKIVSVVFKLLDALLTKLVKYTPKIVAAVFNILVACLNGIAEGLPKVVKAAVDIVESFLKGLGEQIPRVIQAGAELAVALVQGIADSSLYLINAGIDIIVNFLNGIGQTLGRVVQAGWDLIINFIDGITASISANTPRLVSSIKELFKAVLNAAVTVLTGGVVDLESSGGNLIEGFKKGITSKLSTLWDKVKGGFERFKKKVANFFGIHSPSKVFAEFGQYLDEGLIVGLNKYSGKVSNSAENVGKDAIKSMSGAIYGISSAVDSDIDSQPTIRPVMDLSNIESGANTIGDLLGRKQSVDVLANVGSISTSMNSRQNIGASDIISAIKSLSSSIANGQGGVVYNVNGVTYDDGSNIADAISTLVRAAKIERRI